MYTVSKAYNCLVITEPIRYTPIEIVEYLYKTLFLFFSIIKILTYFKMLGISNKLKL